MTSYDAKPWLKFYPEGVPPEIELTDKTYADLLDETFAAKADLPALHFMGTTIDFATLKRLSAQLGTFLRANHCKPGDVVGIHLPNLPQYLIALTGALRSGCAVTGISPLLTSKEIAYQINDSGAKCLITLDVLFEQRIQPIGDQIPALQCIIATSIADWLPWAKRFLGKLLKKIPSGAVAPIPGKQVLTFGQVLSANPPRTDPVNIAPADTCLIQYTGGTTGLPKGTVLTHRNIVVNIQQITNWVEFDQGGEVMCSAFPLFHLAGLMVGMTSLANGIPQCLIPNPRDTKHICNEIAKYRPTLLTNVPSLYAMLLEEPKFKTLDFSRCKACISGAAPFAVEAIQAFEAVVGQGKVMEVYGMTETSPILTMNPLTGTKKIGTVGIPVQSTRIKLVDVETGTQEVPVGQEGELIANGPQVMQGYHNKPEETVHALRDFQNETWLYTGDVARMDEDGYFSIADRVKDMLIVGGYKVFSREVEETLYQHPAIEICAIVGLPNPDRPGSELVKAVIQKTSTVAGQNEEKLKEEILAYCRANMAPYKVPKMIQFMPSIPLTAVGKVDKKALR